MSRRRTVLQRLKTLREIGSIMNSLKNISLMETRKIARFLSSQQQALGSIEAAAADFLPFFPAVAEAAPPAFRVCLVVGSERGFCGDFNHTLLAALDALQGRAPQDQVVAVGRKLCLEAGERYPSAILCDGPGVADEVSGILSRLVEALNGVQAKQGPYVLTMLHHTDGQPEPRTTQLLPPFRAAEPPAARRGHAPDLLLPPRRFFAELVRHYLFAALHEAFYTSLMAEHQQRVRHLEGATQRIDEQSAALVQKSNVLRQEEITEEIEEIMLGAAGT